VDRAHGVVVVPDLHRGFATSGKSDKLVVFDLETLKVVKQVDTGQNPDALLYVSATKEVWSFNGKSANVTCVDAASLEVKATIALDGKPELAVEDAEKGLVYANLEDKSVVAVLESKGHKALATHPLAPGEEPTGIAFDAKDGLLFCGCGNQKMVALSTSDWKVVGTADIGEHCDGAAFDPGTGIAYAPSRTVTTAVHVKDAKTIEVLPTLDTPNARTCAVDPLTHRLFVSSSPHRGETGVVKLTVFGPADAASR
jgi:DNA-binding beta-propeller fold protein YncE